MTTPPAPAIFADVPDPDVVFDGRHYYLVATTMYFAPSVPLLRSSDLVHWSIVGYTAPILEDHDALALRGGTHAYGQGTWAASLRYHAGVYYVSVASLTTRRTYVYSTPSIEDGPWTRSVLEGYAHDQSLLFDGDDVLLVYGAGSIEVRRLRRADDGTFTWDGPATTLVTDASLAENRGLPAEGAHAYKIGEHYYVFMIEWPQGGLRRQIVWRSTALTPQAHGGVWEARVLLDQGAEVAGRPGTGVAQGGIVQGLDGQWCAMLFQDEGPLGRCPQLARVTWEDDGWPVFELEPAPQGPAAIHLTDIVTSDEFGNLPGPAGYWSSTGDDPATAPHDAWNGSNLALTWQWNHNPDNRYWSLTERPGYLRLTTGSLAQGLTDARNTLTQRTSGPTCSAAISLDVSHMCDGDVAGLALLQHRYGYVAVTMTDGRTNLVMGQARTDGTGELTTAPIPLHTPVVYLRAEADFADRADRGSFAYSLDATHWTSIGDDLAMDYSLAHFTGYRFAIFSYATARPGGYVDVDWFRVGDDVGRSPRTA